MVGVAAAAVSCCFAKGLDAVLVCLSRKSAGWLMGKAVYGPPCHAVTGWFHISLCVTFSFAIQGHIFNLPVLLNVHSQADVAQCCKNIMP